MQEPVSRGKGEKFSFVVFVASIAALSGILFGFDTGVISGAILYIGKEFPLSPLTNGIVVSGVLFGAFIGAGFSGKVTDYIGRRRLLITTALIFIVGTLISAMAPDVDALVIGRMVVGVAIGVSSFAAPLYISEISPRKFRGALVSLNQLAITVGIMVAYFVDYHFSPTGSWRMMLGVGIIPAAGLFFGMLFLPYSPRWMMLRGSPEKARAILHRIREDHLVEQELSEIEKSIHRTEEKNKFSLLFKSWLWPVLFVGLGLGFFQQFGGINTIIYYAPTVFRMAGFHSGTAAILATAGVGVANVLFTIIAIPLIDSWGRRPLLLVGIFGMMISLGCMSYGFYVGADTAALKWMTFGSMILYIACFAVSLGPIMWLVISEIFPLQVRAIGTSSCISASWACNMLVALTFLTLIQLFGTSGTFLMYGIICLFGLLFVFFFVPETKYVSLEQIETNLRAGKPSRYLGRPRKAKG